MDADIRINMYTSIENEIKSINMLNLLTKNIKLNSPVHSASSLPTSSDSRELDDDFLYIDKKMHLLEGWVGHPKKLHELAQCDAWTVEDTVCALCYNRPSLPDALTHYPPKEILLRAVLMSRYMKLDQNEITYESVNRANEVRRLIWKAIAAKRLKPEIINGCYYLTPQMVLKWAAKNLPEHSPEMICKEIAGRIADILVSKSLSATKKNIFKEAPDLVAEFLQTGRKLSRLNGLLRAEDRLPKLNPGRQPNNM